MLDPTDAWRVRAAAMTGGFHACRVTRMLRSTTSERVRGRTVAYAGNVPERARSHEQETESFRAFERALPSRWVDRRLVPDYGLDYTVEIFDEERKATPFSFHAQLKATDEEDHDKALRGVRFAREWAEHYRSLPIPVLIVRYLAEEDKLFARWFHAYNPHVALQAPKQRASKTIRFAFTEADAWTDSTPDELRAAVEAFAHFRSPELALPLRFAVASNTADPLPSVFALRAVCAPVSDILAVESDAPGPNRPHITLGARSSNVALADVASVTLDYEDDAQRDPKAEAANLATAIAIALTRVGQPNLAAQVAAACSAESTAILDFDVVLQLAQAFFRSNRIADCLRLADQIGERPRLEGRLPGLLLQTAVMGRHGRLSDDEAELAIAVSRRRLQRTLDAGESEWAAADAYNLGQALRRRRDEEAVEAYEQAAELDPSYESRGYFNSDLAGLLFETGRYEESADRYARALAADGDPFLSALMGDALLWSGCYAAARDALETYVKAGSQARDAEWRLKLRALDAIQTYGGDLQVRDPEAAASTIAPYALDSEDVTADEALAAYDAALRVDACCAEAWFRSGVLSFGVFGDPVRAFDRALAAGVLHRRSPGAWINTITLSRVAGLPDDLVRDCLRMAYRFCGAALADDVMAAARAPAAPPDSGLLAMLDEVMREVDEADAPAAFTLRLPDGDGAMDEFSFVTELPRDATSMAHGPLPSADESESGGPLL